MENKTLFQCENVTKIFQKNKSQGMTAVNNVNLTIEEGVSYGLVGESSSGKSTLANMLVNIINPTSGKILYRGRDLLSLTKKEQKDFRRQVQVIFQNPSESLNPKMKIKTILEEPLIIHKIGKDHKERMLMVNEMRTLCGISLPMLEKYPSELSGGQQQRVAICSALILKPRLLICDEAVASLDVLIQSQILNMLRSMQKSLNLTYFFISHNLNVISYIADKIGVMYLGNIVEEGTTEDIINNPKHPYTKALFSASYTIKETDKQRIILKGELPDPFSPPEGCPFSTRCSECMEICKKEKPVTKILENGHKVACHLIK